MLALVLVILAWGTGTEGQDGYVGESSVLPEVPTEGDHYEVGQEVPLLRRGIVLDATLTPIPAEIPTPAAVQDVSEPANANDNQQRDSGTNPRTGQGIAAQDRLLAGYRDGGGDPAQETRVLAMVECESGFGLDPPGTHLGAAQFEPGTWATAASVSGLWDYTNPYHTGYNVAVWMAMIPGRWGTTLGWPNCWK